VSSDGERAPAWAALRPLSRHRLTLSGTPMSSGNTRRNFGAYNDPSHNQQRELTWA